MFFQEKTKLKVLAFFLSAVVLSFPLEITALTEITASSESAVLSDEYESVIMPMSAISTYDVGRTYRLRNRGSGMYLDISGNGTTNGTPVQQYPKGEYPSDALDDISRQRRYVCASYRSCFCGYIFKRRYGA